MISPMRTSDLLSSLIAILAPVVAELGLLRDESGQDVVTIVHDLPERM